MKWRIYYDGGGIYSDEDGAPENAPGVGVLIIAEQDADAGRRLIHGKDYFIWKDGHWLEVDRAGLFDYLFCQTGYKIVLAGRIVTNVVFQTAYARAYYDDGLPVKTAGAAFERTP